MRRFLPICCFLLVLSGARPVFAADPPLKPMDIFDLEYAADPQISPDGTKVVFVRNSLDLMKDRGRSRLWVVNADGSDLRPLTSGAGNESYPRWSPDGKRLAYVSDVGGSAQLYCLWFGTRETAKRPDLPGQPAAPDWSPARTLIAFAAFVEEPEKPFVELPV